MFERRKIKDLLLKMEMYKKEFEANGLYSVLETECMKEYINKSLANKGVLKDIQLLQYFFDIAKDLDGKTKVDLEVGKTIDELVNDKENMMYIHRTNLNLDENNMSESLGSIMKDGLINYEHANADGQIAINVGAPILGATLSPMVSLTGYENLLSNWHNCDSIIVLSIPRVLINNDFECTNPDDIYNKVNNRYYIKPEFIVGNLVKKDNMIIKFDLKEDILKHSNQNNK